MKSFLLIALIAISISAQSQVSIGAGAGYKNGFAGNLNAGYKYKEISFQADMLSLPFKKQTFFSLKTGYVFTISDDYFIIPYAGPSYNLVGNTHTEDRYVHDNTTEILARNREVNEVLGNFGLQVVKGYVYADLNYTRGFSAAIGLRYTFKN